jgi:hypothetical protein
MVKTIIPLPNSMGWVLAVAAVALSVASGQEPGQQGKTAQVRDIDLQGLTRRATHAVATKPARISSAEELARAFPDADAKWLDRVAKQVDFDREELVFFAWTGSNTDGVAAKVEQTDRGPVVVFTFEPGYGEDMPHARFRMFAVAGSFRLGTTR